MSPELIILICFSGVICIALEVYLPGGVLGIAGAAILIWSVVEAYKHNSNFGTMLLFCGLGGSMAASWFSFKYFSSTKEGKKALLMDISTKVPESRHLFLLHKQGVATCDLRPSGKIEIEDEIYDAQSKGEYIHKGSFVIVTLIEGDHIYVKESKNNLGETA
jgi:membrane-bound serine protease (ClpP class)